MFPPEQVWLGWVSFCIKQSIFCFTLVCCVLCELWVGVGSRLLQVLGRGGKLTCAKKKSKATRRRWVRLGLLPVVLCFWWPQRLCDKLSLCARLLNNHNILILDKKGQSPSARPCSDRRGRPQVCSHQRERPSKCYHFASQGWRRLKLSIPRLTGIIK